VVSWPPSGSRENQSDKQSARQLESFAGTSGWRAIAFEIQPWRSMSKKNGSAKKKSDVPAVVNIVDRKDDLPWPLNCAYERAGLIYLQVHDIIFDHIIRDEMDESEAAAILQTMAAQFQLGVTLGKSCMERRNRPPDGAP
jgi:hypothetical protein